MLRTGVLNPAVNSLLSRVRHTNLLVIADRGFPFWKDLEIVDLSLVDDIPTVLQVWNAIRPGFNVGKVWMAHEFRMANPDVTLQAFENSTANIGISYLSHTEFKQMVPKAIGLIRTGDTTQYANMIIESA